MFTSSGAESDACFCCFMIVIYNIQYANPQFLSQPCVICRYRRGSHDTKGKMKWRDDRNKEREGFKNVRITCKNKGMDVNWYLLNSLCICAHERSAEVFEADDFNHMRRAINPDWLSYFYVAVCPPLKSEKRGLRAWKGLQGAEESQQTVGECVNLWVSWEFWLFFWKRLIHHGSGVWANTLTLCNSLCNSLCCQPFCVLLRKLWVQFRNRTIQERDKNTATLQLQGNFINRRNLLKMLKIDSFAFSDFNINIKLADNNILAYYKSLIIFQLEVDVFWLPWERPG